eukprot:gene7423-13182_t
MKLNDKGKNLAIVFVENLKVLIKDIVRKEKARDIDGITSEEITASEEESISGENLIAALASVFAVKPDVTSSGFEWNGYADKDAEVKKVAASSPLQKVPSIGSNSWKTTSENEAGPRKTKESKYLLTNCFAANSHQEFNDVPNKVLTTGLEGEHMFGSLPKEDNEVFEDYENLGLIDKETESGSPGVKTTYKMAENSSSYKKDESNRKNLRYKSSSCSGVDSLQLMESADSGVFECFAPTLDRVRDAEEMQRNFDRSDLETDNVIHKGRNSGTSMKKGHSESEKPCCSNGTSETFSTTRGSPKKFDSKIPKLIREKRTDSRGIHKESSWVRSLRESILKFKEYDIGMPNKCKDTSFDGRRYERCSSVDRSFGNLETISEKCRGGRIKSARSMVNLSRISPRLDNPTLFWKHRTSLERSYSKYMEDEKQVVKDLKFDIEYAEANRQASRRLKNRMRTGSLSVMDECLEENELINEIAKDLRREAQRRKSLVKTEENFCHDESLNTCSTRLTSFESSFKQRHNKPSRIPIYEGLEHLQKIAEKTEKEAAALEKALDKIDEEANSIEVKADELGSGEVRRRHIQLDKALMVFEPTVKTLIANVEILLSGKHDEAEEIQVRVKNIASRWQLLKLRITTIIEKETTMELKRTSRMSGHQIQVTRDTTVSDEPFDSQIEIEPGVMLDAADLEGYNVQYKTTKTVVTVRSNVTEEEIEETERVRKVESEMTEDEIAVFTEAGLEQGAGVLQEKKGKSKEAESVIGDAGPGEAGSSESTPASPAEHASSPSAQDESMSEAMSEAMSETSSTMEDPERRRRSRKRRSRVKLPGIFACTRKTGSVISSSSDEEDNRPVKMKPGQTGDQFSSAKFQEIEITLSWIASRKAILDKNEFGFDLPTNERLLEENDQLHKEIHQFQSEVDKTCSLQMNDPPPEIIVKIEEVRASYAKLMDLCIKRKRNLTFLVHFMKEATNELLWMSQKEETEVSRDWSDKSLDLVEIDQYRKEWDDEFKEHKANYNAITQKGNDLMNDQHPGSAAIAAYIEVMSTQWNWLLQLRIALDKHMEHTQVYVQFYHSAHEIEKWLTVRVNLLTSMFEGLQVTNESVLNELIGKMKVDVIGDNSSLVVSRRKISNHYVIRPGLIKSDQICICELPLDQTVSSTFRANLGPTTINICNIVRNVSLNADKGWRLRAVFQENDADYGHALFTT